MAQSVKDLMAAATRAEEQAATLAQKLVDAELAEATAVGRLCTELANGTCGKPIADLAAARDAAQLRVVSARKDAEAARLGAKAARRAAAEAGFAARTVELSARLASAAKQIEESLRSLAERWATWDALATDARELGREIAAHSQRFKIPPGERLPRPDAGAAGLTSDCYGHARRAVAVLEVLDNIRREAALPAAPYETVAPPYFIAGESPRALRQRQALRQAAPQRTARGPG